jgi:hypothetical protein
MLRKASAGWVLSTWAFGKLTPIDLPYSEFSSVRAAADRVVFRGGSPSTPSSFVDLKLTTGKT